MIQLSTRLKELIVRSERDFSGISETEASVPAIEGGWSRKQILGHLIDSASNNHQRFVRAQLQDELRWPGYDQSGCVRVQRYQDARWSDLLGFWAAYNRFLAHVLAGVPEENETYGVLDRKQSGNDARGIGGGLPQASGAPFGSDLAGPDPGENLMPWARGSSFDQLMVTV